MPAALLGPILIQRVETHLEYASGSHSLDITIQIALAYRVYAQSPLKPLDEAMELPDAKQIGMLSIVSVSTYII